MTIFGIPDPTIYRIIVVCLMRVSHHNEVLCVQDRLTYNLAAWHPITIIAIVSKPQGYMQLVSLQYRKLKFLDLPQGVGSKNQPPILQWK